MEVTKQLEAELRQFMNVYWDTYFKGDLDAWAKFLPDDYQNIGSTKEEIWRSKQDIVDYTNNVIEQMKGMAEFRNKQTEIKRYDPYIMVHEFGDLYVKVEDGWMFYAPFRLSSLLEKTGVGWQVLHQHGSYPDSKTQEGETFGFDALQVENKRLQQAVQQRTAELEIKNRELEIETALEKVRVVAMGMNNPDDLLDICEVMFSELKKLGFEDLRNAMINIHYDDQSYLLNYDYADRTGKTVTTFKYHTHPIVDHIVDHARHSKETFTQMIYSGDALDELRSFRKQNGEDDDARLDEVDALCYYFYATGTGALGISMYQTASEEQLNILKRFRNVFDLAYKRYTDISIAEAQAREAQVEAALENVRSRSLAMHKSDELQEVVNTVFERLQSLSIEMNVASIFIFKEGTKDWQQWVASSDTHYSTHFHIPYIDNIIFRDLEEAKANKKDFYSVRYSFEEKNNWFNYAFANTEYSRIPDVRKKFLLESPFYQVSFALAKNTGIQLAKYSGNDFTDQDKEILRRFCHVFEQAYTRFLDLQKAETQAREADIELGLERVRARTMAMQQSAELKEVVQTLSTEISRLDLVFTRTSIVIYDPDSLASTWWMSNPETNEAFGVYVKYHALTPYLAHIDAWRQRKRSWQYILEGDDKKQWDQFLFHETDLSQLPGQVKEDMQQNESVFLSCSFSNFGYLVLESAQSISADQFDILSRFAKVFDQTYTRFQDLQKAEAQAREAEIELGLERVRASGMAMQKSQELLDVIRVVGDQLHALGIAYDSALFLRVQQDGSWISWITVPSQTYPKEEVIPFVDTPAITTVNEAFLQGREELTDVYAPQEKNAFFRHFFATTDANDIPELRKEFILNSPGWARSLFFMKDIILIITSFTGIPFTEEENSIFRRFKNVFHQTYTRFLDLQKAEEQAREAEIELGLERVRARAMSMQNSEELGELVAVLFEELTKLHLILARCIIWIFDTDSLDARMWMANSEEKGSARSYHIKYLDHPYYNAILKGWKEKQANWVYDLKGTDKKTIDKFLLEETELSQLPLAVKQGIINTKEVFVAGSFNNFGLIEASGPLRPSGENMDILNRFGKVFDLSYTRFSDLKNVEAQARESQIQLALERVRARTMAMHNSEELLDVILVVSDQLQQLEIPFRNVSFGVNNQDYDLQLWMAIKGNPKAWRIQWTFIDNPGVTGLKKAQQNPDLVYSDELTQEENNEWLQHIFNCNPGLEIFSEENKAFLLATPGYARSIVVMKEIFLVMGNYAPIPYTTEENIILKRFAAVFEQSYTRFLDLQKAEAQAKESQIQLALERVRARTMAMQKSEELQDVVHTLFIRLKELDIEFYTAIIIIFSEDSNDITWWLENKEKQQYAKILVPYTNIAYLRDLMEARKNGSEHFTKVYSFEDKNDLFHHLFSATDFRYVPVKQKTFLLESEAATMSVAIAKNTGIHLTRYADKSFSEKDNEILKRFSKVFDQAYTRFLDLQKAEAQAKEAQIEAALERVRSRSMAMHHTSELQEVIKTVHDQLSGLQIAITGGVFITINEENKEEISCWGAGNTTDYLELVHIPFLDRPIYKDFIAAIQKGPGLYTQAYTHEEKLELFEHLFKIPPYNSASQEHKDEIMSRQGGYTRSAVVSKHACIFMINHHGRQFTAEENNILVRFGKVFEQSYTRFLDLQKAEAQAREAQIEAALEKVRSRSIGMQKSDELKEVIRVIFDQFIYLNIHVDHAGFVVDYQPKGDWHFWIADKQEIPAKISHPYFDSTWAKQFDEAKEKGSDFFATQLDFEEKNQFYTELLSFVPGLSEDARSFYFSCPGLGASTVIMEDVALYIENFAGVLYSEEENNILKRFGKVFQQTYTRFLDLQKAEAQARESQIDAALEKVRSRTMAMQKSEEIMDVVTTIVEKVGELNIEMDGGVSLATLVEDSKDLIHWYVNPDHLDEPRRMHLPYFPCKVYDDFNEARENKRELLSVVYDKEEKNKYFQTAFEISEFAIIPDELKKWILDQDYFGYTVAIQNHAVIFFNDYSGKKFTAAENDILLRFSKVFEHAYTRFIDLQKAEAQARESQIQLALERVRARTMAMQKSAELPEAAYLLFQQIKALGMPTWSAGYNILSSDKTSSLCIMSSEGETQIPFTLPLTEHKSFIPWYEAILRNDDLFVDELGGEDLVDHYRYLKSLPELRPVFQQFDDAGISLPTFQINHLARFNQGFLLFITYEPVPESHEIFKRFAKVFEQTYTRFLDLQKAEAQARESQIEAALEKVRSRSLAMHKTDELKEVVLVIVEKLQELGVVLDANGVILCTYFNNSRDVLHWIASPDFSFAGSYLLPYFEHPIFSQAWESKEKGDEYFSKAFSVEEKNSFFEYAFEHSDYKYFPEEFKQWVFQNDQHILSFAWQKNSAILIPSHTGVVPTTDEVEILKRFARVFEQAYIRFMDLQKAEAQAREAQIEAALEKVRSRTMGMQRSEELGEVAAILFNQLTELGIQHTGCGFVIFNADKPMGDMWFSYRGDVFPQSFPIAFDASPVLAPVYQAWKNREVFYKVFMKGEALAKHLEFLKRQFGSRIEEVLSQMKERMLEEGKEMPDQMIMHHTYFSKGSLILNNFNDITDQPILNRFAQVFEQTYTRFLDIQNAEAQAREAQIEGALEKVRSRTLAMQHSNELAETAAVLFQQLIQLGITPNRLYIAIVKDETGATEFWITDEDGTKISTAYTANLNDNMSFEKMLAGWQQQEKSLVIDMQGEELQRYFRHLTSLGTPFKDGLDQKRRVQYIAYFGKGFIGMASPDEQPPETLKLLERFAYVFNLTFTRFHDLQIAEAHAKKAEQDLMEIKEARKNAETALVELQATQKQLIQSEKMASLGELTAGIAHEIQNPLNFVNNFSEVSNELLDEIKQELEKGDYGEVKLMIEDVKQNLEKINHHGKRADGIVKGMLQHSRTSTGQKEQTDINSLCDEYLRLAYHGLRAKDKAFNAELTTDFDDKIGKLSIVPQEIGRVLLNLLNNAFYAVKEKSKEGISRYQPTVTLTTHKLDDKIEISVKDNGNGIAGHIKEKIFQPFFTTKPTGQGTGLGLSLSYDIVKAHGGELTLKTKEKEGTEFVLQLPVA